MPAFFSHYRFGVYCYKRLERCSLKQAIMRYPHAFCVGTQGPDLFFYHVLGGLLADENYGIRLHSERTGFFLNELINVTLQTADKDEKEIKASYVAGFISHYLLDCYVHGYIYARIGTKKSKEVTGMHFELESDIDLRLLEKYEGKTPSNYSPAQIVALSSLEKDSVASLLSKCVSKTLRDKDLSKRQARQVTAEMRMGLSMMKDPTEIKGKIVRFIEKHILGYAFAAPLLCNNLRYDLDDPCNERHAVWKNPYGNDKSRESFFELMELAEAEFLWTAPVLDQVLFQADAKKQARERLSMMLGNRSYKSGYEME